MFNTFLREARKPESFDFGKYSRHIEITIFPLDLLELRQNERGRDEQEST